MVLLLFSVLAFYPADLGKTRVPLLVQAPPAVSPGQTTEPVVPPVETGGKVQLFPQRKSGAVVLRQGQVFMIKVSELPDNVDSLQATWEDQTIPLLPDTAPGQYVGLGAIDLEKSPGRYEITITALTSDHRQLLSSASFMIVARQFSRARLSVAPDKVHLSAEAEAKVAADREAFRAVWENPSREKFWAGPFLRPVPGRITAGFGQRRVYNGEIKSVHSGVDLAADIGDPIRATTAGKVALVREAYIEGKTVVLDHGGGFFTLYCHLSQIKVEAGQMVEKGQVIGLAGATGRVTGPHLHYGCNIQRTKADPLTLLLLNPWLK